jgi:hypothetical protein
MRTVPTIGVNLDTAKAVRNNDRIAISNRADT